MKGRRVMVRSAVAVVLLAAGAVRAGDEFDRLDGRALAGIPKAAGAKARASLTVGELGTLPYVLKGVRAPLLVMVTDQGNLVRWTATGALRKGKGEPAPIVIVERFDTFEGGPATTRIARGRDVVLFEGFRYDFDTGQVVPEGQGGDIALAKDEKTGLKVVAEPGAKLFVPTKSPLEEPEKGASLTAGRRVEPEDFGGRFRVFANGQWSGTLELEVAAKGSIGGRFRSDQTGSAYRVTGQIGPESPQRVRFSVQFPRSTHEYDGYLWTDGKGAIAGSVTLLEQTYGFFAIREGGRFAPEGESDAIGGTGPARRVIVLKADGSGEMEGKAVTMEAAAKAGGAGSPFELRVPQDVKAGRLAEWIGSLKGAGVRVIVIGEETKP